jgi:hypothetical protein
MKMIWDFNTGVDMGECLEFKTFLKLLNGTVRANSSIKIIENFLFF